MICFRTFSNVRWKSFEIIRAEPFWTDFTEKLLVQGEREWDVDDGEVVDGEAAEDANQEEV